ncbi:MAG TPA: PQQ-dependent sugar dehydrogenase [Actinomycetota bacterium]|nr:PQQ-dependent sugar dehydrogenase [Actinomycetota bacterium]
MRRLLPLLVILATALGAVPVQLAGAIPKDTRLETYRGDLAFPIDMAWVPGTKKIFFTEKNTGKIRVMVGGRLLRRACVDLDVEPSDERGALGIALHPKFERNHFLYVYYTNREPLENRVARFRVRDNRCRSKRVLVKGLSTKGATNHNGGQLEFMRGKLFVSTGEAGDPAEAQDEDSRLGKILRYNPDGSIPAGNPFSEPGDRSPVWSIGHRNPFGLAARPGTNRLYSTENGPFCDDELNRIRPKANYGWGVGYECGTRGVGPSPRGPIRRWSDVVVPTDAWWYEGRMKSLSGSLYAGDFDGNLHRFFMNAKGTRVREDRIIYSGAGPIVDVAKGPGGWLYFMTPETMYRIVPARG